VERLVNQVCIIGLGYIGLPTASLLASKGFSVHGVDVNARVVEMINQGHAHIYEPELDELVKQATESGQLRASLQPAHADVFMIAVPTPFQGEHQPDLSYVESATRAIAAYVESGNLIILESTSPVGTTEKVRDWLAEQRPELFRGSTKPVYIAHCPERVLPGQIIKELVHNDRIVGGLDEASTARAKAFYEQFVHGRILTTNARTAELAKLTENAYRDVNIAFANEVSLICDHLGINAWELISLANHHPRVNILQPGPGVGGHCIAVDPWFIIDAAPNQAKLMHQARIVNDHKPHHILSQVDAHIREHTTPVIACLGLSFKKNIDDLRESPALFIAEALAERYPHELLVVEPHIQELPSTLRQPHVSLVTLSAAMERANIVVLLVDHDAFAAIDRTMLQEKQIIDTRGLWR
jgi:UDP-N-acetyl-D-mannosaminuronic acid dehydrogenase